MENNNKSEQPNKKSVSASQAMKIMEEHCKSLGILSTRNQSPNGTASIHITNKSKKNNS